MADHQHGSMDVTAQQKTFVGFIRWVMIVAAFSVATLFFLTLYNS